MHALDTFVWGFLGSASVEVVSILSFYHSRGGRLPERYRKVGFWVTRAFLAVVAGTIAVGYDIDQRILAFNVGAATPLIIGFMARGLRAATPSALPETTVTPERRTTHDHAGTHKHGASTGRR